MNPEAAHLAELTAKLKANLDLCATADGQQPSVDAVHDVRTGTRRIEAILDAIETSMQRDGSGAFLNSESGLQTVVEASEAIARWRRLLKKIRRSAGAVRDLDVHRGLLRDRLAQPDTGLTVEDGRTALTAIEQQAADLDAWLKHTRQQQSGPLVQGAAKWAAKLDAHLAAVSGALAARPATRKKPASAAVTALDAFARLSSDMQQLYAENLHDFRKGAKKARYMAETGGADEHAGAVGKALKKLQDEIGDWHDWLVLAEEAHRALGEQGAELIARIEQEREDHYRRALKTAERMRGRLMGEWRASTPASRRASKSATT